jgi:hypothetical protein
MKPPLDKQPIVFWAFWAGYIGNSALKSFIQDLYGKQRYIELVQEKWISSKITIPLAVLLFFLTVYFILKAIYREAIINDHIKKAYAYFISTKKSGSC